MEDFKNLCERLNNIVIDGKKTMVQIAAEASIGYQTIYEFRRGKGNPRLNILVKLDEYLKTLGY